MVNALPATAIASFAAPSRVIGAPKQGGISFSTNQRFCLHFCPKPIRMRKTLHHMKFVNKRMGLLQIFSASVFLGFCHEIDICCS
jgi:hypothetical protein